MLPAQIDHPELALRVFGIALLGFAVAAYSLIAVFTLRRFGALGLALVWVVSAATLTSTLVLRLRLFAGGLAISMSVLIAAVPFFTSAGSSLFIWRLHKRSPEAGVSRFVLHGLIGFGVGLLALLLAAAATDIANLL